MLRQARRLAVALFFGVPPTLAAQPARILSVAPRAKGPCSFDPIDINRWGTSPLRLPPVEHSRNGALQTRLTVKYTDPRSVSIAGCGVTLRTYNGALVGPTLRIKPGDALRIDFRNRLPRESAEQVDAEFQQQIAQAHVAMRPAAYNTTNLHTHGLHVSPSGHQDNVLLAIAPQSRFAYDIRVPNDHPAGTFWYHAHTHGSTAIQVGSGMEGALIVEDDETKIPASLREANRHEQVLILQTILYDTFGRVDDITAFFPDGASSQEQCRAGSSSCTWRSSNRRLTINGQIVPIIRMHPGEVQRWRLIDAAFRESIHLSLEGHALHEIALDGLYLGHVDTWKPSQTVDLEPGYRSDVLVQASRVPGTYRLIDAAKTPAQSLRAQSEPGNVIAEVVVAGDPLNMALPTSGEMARLAPFPGVDLRRSAIGEQEVNFKLGSDLEKDASKSKLYFQINYAPYTDNHKRYLQLGATDEWTLRTVGDPFDGIPPLPHVFHIHTNPFQVERPDPDGKLELVWKDTQLVPAGQTVKVYTRYTDFTGRFVIHCHILDHEDLGMMEAVEIVRTLPPSAMRHP